MPDPLTVAGTAVSAISLGIQVIQTLVSFYTSYKSLNSDLAHMTNGLESLLDVFQSLEKTLSDDESQTNED